MKGDTYLERGRPVVLLARWRGTEAITIAPHQSERIQIRPPRRGKQQTGPRNVLIQREDGSLVVRPFRGLRRAKGDA